MQNSCIANLNFVKKTKFSNEAIFCLGGNIDIKYRIWSKDNPRCSRHVQTHYPEKIYVWTGMIDSKIIATSFIEDHLFGPRYFDLLRNTNSCGRTYGFCKTVRLRIISEL